MAFYNGTVNMFKQTVSSKEVDKLKETYNWTPPKGPNVRPIVEYSLQGEIIKVWDSLNQIRSTGKYRMNIIKLCLGHNTAKSQNSIWIYRDELPYVLPQKIIPPARMNWNIDEVLIK